MTNDTLHEKTCQHFKKHGWNERAEDLRLADAIYERWEEQTRAELLCKGSRDHEGLHLRLFEALNALYADEDVAGFRWVVMSTSLEIRAREDDLSCGKGKKTQGTSLKPPITGP